MKSIIYRQLGDTITKKQFLPKDIGLTSRQVNYWKERNIIPFLEKDKKGFMNIAEALWLMIINELSNIGIDSKKLEVLSNKVWLVPFHEKYADSVFKEHLKNSKYGLSDEEKSWLVHYLGFENIMNDLYRRIINPFTDSVKACLVSNRELVSIIYCPRTEEFRFSYSNTIISSELNNLFYGETLITIPFLPHLAKLVGLEIERYKEDLTYLTSIENQIRRTLVFDKPKLMEIEVQENGEKRIFKITEQHKKAEELAHFFLKTKLPLGAKIIIETRAQGNFKITVKT